MRPPTERDGYGNHPPVTIILTASHPTLYLFIYYFYQGGYVFAFVCLSVSKIIQESCRQILIKFIAGVERVAGSERTDSGGDSNTGIFQSTSTIVG